MAYLLFENGQVGTLSIAGFQPASSEQYPIVQTSIENECDQRFADSAQAAASYIAGSLRPFIKKPLPIQLHLEIRLRQQVAHHLSGQSAGLGFVIALIEYLCAQSFGPVYASGIIDYQGRVHPVAGIDEKLDGLLQNLAQHAGRHALCFVSAQQQIDPARIEALEAAGCEVIRTASVTELIEKLLGIQVSRLSSGSPYKGLKSFEYQDSWLFCGRGQAIGELVTLIEELVGDAHSRVLDRVPMLLIEGKVGVGKSSLVKAGLFPALMNSGVLPRFRRKLWCGLRSSHEAPLSTLFSVLEQADHRASPAPAELTRLREALGQAMSPQAGQAAEQTFDEVCLVFEQLLALLFSSSPEPGEHSHCVFLLLDQFEELLIGEQHTEQQKVLFFRVLRQISQHDDPVVVPVLTMRSDYHGNLMDYPVLQQVFRPKGLGERYELMPPTEQEYAEIIERPASIMGLRFASHQGINLADRLRQDALQLPNALALLEFTLDELFDHVTASGELDYQHYLRIGGLQGVVSSRAEAAFQSVSGAAQQEIGKLFTRLIGLDLKTEKIYARRELHDQVVDSAAMAELVTRLVEAQLIERVVDKKNQQLIRFVHEMLFYSWQRIVDWIQAERERLRLIALVDSQFSQWSQADGAKARKEFLVPLGDRLNQAMRMLEERVAVTGEFRRYILESWRYAKRKQRFLILSSIVFALTTLAAVIVGVIAVKQQKSLLHKAVLATAANLLDKDPTRSFRYAERVFARTGAFAAEKVIWNALTQPMYAADFRHHSYVKYAAFIDKTPYYLSVTAKGRIRVWRRSGVVARYQHPAAIELARAVGVTSEVIFADARQRLFVWNYRTGRTREIKPDRGKRGEVVSILVAPDQQTLVIDYFDRVQVIASKGFVLKHEIPLPPVTERGRSRKQWNALGFVNGHGVLFQHRSTGLNTLDVRTGVFRSFYDRKVHSVYVRPNHRIYLVPQQGDELLLAYDASSYRKTAVYADHGFKRKGIDLLAVTDAGQVYFSYHNSFDQNKYRLEFNTGSLDKGLQRYDYKGKTALRGIDRLYQLTVRRRGKRLELMASTRSNRNTVQLHRQGSPGGLHGILKGHIDSIISLKHSSRKRQLLTVSKDYSVKVWDDTALSGMLTGQADRPLLDFRQQGKKEYFLYRTGDSSLELEIRGSGKGSGRVTKKLSLSTVPVVRAQLHPPTGSVILVGADRSLSVYRYTDNKQVFKLQHHQAKLRYYTIVAGNRLLLRTMRRRFLAVDLKTGALVRRMPGRFKYHYYNPDAPVVVLQHRQNNEYEIWDHHFARRMLRSDVAGEIKVLRISPRLESIVYAYLHEKGGLRLAIRHYRTGRYVYRSRPDDFKALTDIDVSKDGRWVALAHAEGVRLFDTRTKRYRFIPTPDHIARVRFLADGRQLLLTASDNNSYYYKSGQLLLLSPDKGNTLTRVAYADALDRKVFTVGKEVIAIERKHAAVVLWNTHWLQPLVKLVAGKSFADADYRLESARVYARRIKFCYSTQVLGSRVFRNRPVSSNAPRVCVLWPVSTRALLARINRPRGPAVPFKLSATELEALGLD